jgi:transitional endoplasmic reticulum ATPase
VLCGRRRRRDALTLGLAPASRRIPPQEGYSGADLAEIAKRACKLAIRDDIAAEQDGTEGVSAILERHFDEAMTTARRSVTPSELAKYESFRLKYKGGDATKAGADDSAAADDGAASEGDAPTDDLYA